MNSSATRWVPLSGIVFVALIVVGMFVGGDIPSATDSAEKIAAFYSDEKTKVQIGVMVFGIGLLAGVLFASYLSWVLRKGEGETGILPRVAFAGIVIFAAGAAFDATMLIAMSEAAEDIEPSQLQTMQAVWDNDFLPMAVGIALFILASGVSIVLHKSLPAWLGWLAIVIGIVGVTPLGWFAFMATGAWILIVSVMLLIEEGKASAPVVE